MTDFMPSMDVSAALQAAVAAAAEIARVGLSENQLVELQPRTPAATKEASVASPGHDSNKNPVAKQQPQHGFSISPALAVATPAVTSTSLLGRQQQQQASVYQAIAEAPSVDSTAYSSETEQQDQCAAYRSTRHDSVGDQSSLATSTASTIPSHNQQHANSPFISQNHSNNDTLSVASSNGEAEQPGTPGDDDDKEANDLEESEEDAAKRLARSRERNREHARRTRLRKKAQLEHLQQKVRGLETEKKGLKQKIEECSIASILINLAEPSEQEQQQQQQTASLLDDTMKKQENNDSEAKISLLTAGKRKRFASIDNTSEKVQPTQALKLKIDGQTKIIGPKSHINWKSGVYSDDHGVQRQLTSEQLEGLRRERNRMHAKMTRDRKKNFIATIEKTIEELERDCQRMRDVLSKVGAHDEAAASAVTPASTAAPVITPLPSPHVGIAPSKPVLPDTPKLAAVVEQPVAPLAYALPAALVLTTAQHIQSAPAPTLLTSPAAKLQEPTLKSEEPIASTGKRAKVAHGFSWEG